MNASGFAWDPIQGTDTASEAVWEAYTKASAMFINFKLAKVNLPAETPQC
jgi:hypothetical protein